MDDNDPFSEANIRAHGMPPTTWVGLDGSPEAEAAAGLPPGFLARKRAGAGHRYALVRSGKGVCDDPSCPY